MEYKKSICDHNCKDCIFVRNIDCGTYEAGTIHSQWCGYMEKTGMVRNCPAGLGCKKKKTEYNPESLAQEIGGFSIVSSSLLHQQSPEQHEMILQKNREKVREKKERYKAFANGRQREVLLSYKTENNLSIIDFGNLIGVSSITISMWLNEKKPANWMKLRELGILKPEGL